ncbi:MAG: hypothetical protein JXR42_01315 [Gammaproteobacteria bacterium]|nr:hypothetical protein [Gammaproteobacteria bacterium]
MSTDRYSKLESTYKAMLSNPKEEDQATATYYLKEAIPNLTRIRDLLDDDLVPGKDEELCIEIQNIVLSNQKPSKLYNIVDDQGLPIIEHIKQHPLANGIIFHLTLKHITAANDLAEQAKSSEHQKIVLYFIESLANSDVPIIPMIADSIMLIAQESTISYPIIKLFLKLPDLYEYFFSDKEIAENLGSEKVAQIKTQVNIGDVKRWVNDITKERNITTRDAESTIKLARGISEDLIIKKSKYEIAASFII